MEEHYINGRRAYTEREATEILRLPRSTVQAAIARGELRTAQGHMSRYILGPELRRFADRRGLKVRLPDDLTEEELEELEQLRAEARAREQRAQERDEEFRARANSAADAREFDALRDRYQATRAYDRGQR